jgi:hypothetical protein
LPHNLAATLKAAKSLQASDKLSLGAAYQSSGHVLVDEAAGAGRCDAGKVTVDRLVPLLVWGRSHTSSTCHCDVSSSTIRWQTSDRATRVCRSGAAHRHVAPSPPQQDLARPRSPACASFFAVHPAENGPCGITPHSPQERQPRASPAFRHATDRRPRRRYTAAGWTRRRVALVFAAGEPHDGVLA